MRVSKANIKRFIGLTILFLIVVFVGKALFFSEKFIPDEFTTARIDGSKIAEEIVAQSNYSAEILREISKLDREGKYMDAFNIVSQELVKNREANKKAATLSTRLERMARFIGEIQPYRAKQLATEALSSEVALVSRLLNYNVYLGQLFATLQQKFQSGNSHTNGQVQELVNQINEEIRTINELNARFNDSLERFDGIF